MSKLKQCFFILFFFFLLVAVAVLPIMITQYHNNRLINKINITTLPPEFVENNEAMSESYHILERLQTIKNTSYTNFIVTGDYSVVESQMDLTKEQNNIIHDMEEQLFVLQNKGALPQFTFSKEYKTSIKKRMYIDTKKPNATISIWEIQVEYDDFFVDTYMDAETAVIYDVFIYSKGKMTFEPAELNGFEQYLQIDSKNISPEGEIFYASGYYFDNIIRLFVVYYDKSLQNATVYKEYAIENALENALEYTYTPLFHYDRQTKINISP